MERGGREKERRGVKRGKGESKTRRENEKRNVENVEMRNVENLENVEMRNVENLENVEMRNVENLENVEKRNVENVNKINVENGVKYKTKENRQKRKKRVKEI